MPQFHRRPLLGLPLSTPCSTRAIANNLRPARPAGSGQLPGLRSHCSCTSHPTILRLKIHNQVEVEEHARDRPGHHDVPSPNLTGSAGLIAGGWFAPHRRLGTASVMLLPICPSLHVLGITECGRNSIPRLMRSPCSARLGRLTSGGRLENSSITGLQHAARSASLSLRPVAGVARRTLGSGRT